MSVCPSRVSSFDAAETDDSKLTTPRGKMLTRAATAVWVATSGTGSGPNTARGYAKLRKRLQTVDQHGKAPVLEDIYEGLWSSGYVTGGGMAEAKLRVDPQSAFNIHARVGAGLVDQPANEKTGWLGTDIEHEKLSHAHRDRFVVASNR
eukprot:1961983-Prymnesium_polylepis.1